MTAHLNRAMLLVEQSRFALAEQELHLALAAQPGHSFAHSLLAICLVERQAFTEATQAAHTAIGCGPDEPFAHYTLARVLFARNEFDQSAQAIGEALALDPFQPQFHSQLAAVRLEQRRWPEALESAERGLALEPEHIGCANLRAIALVRLGRRLEAEDTLSTALSHDPNNALSHANVGWTMLEARKYEQAMDHFRESLRLDAECEWARMGIVETLKARHILYGWLLRYFLWTTKLSRSAHVAIVLLGIVFLNVANVGLQQLPGGQWASLVLIGAYGSFAFLTWSGEALFNLILRFDKVGKHALSDEEKRTSNQVAACLGAGVLALGLWPLFGAIAGLVGCVMCFLLVIPVAGAARCPEGWPRQLMESYTGGLALLGAVCLVLLCVDGGQETYWELLGTWLFVVFCVGIVASTWIGSGLSAVRMRR